MRVMTISEVSYILGKFDALAELLANPPIGPPRIAPSTREMLRNAIAGWMTVCVLEEELDDREEEQRLEAMAVRHTGTISVGVGTQTAGCNRVSVSFSSDDAAGLDKFVQLSKDLWVDKDGCVRLKE